MTTLNITYQIIDRGRRFASNTRQIQLPTDHSPLPVLKKAITSDKDTVKLSRNFRVEIINSVAV